MTVVLPPVEVSEPIDVVVLFPEARRFQRRRRLIWIAMSLLTLALVISITSLARSPSHTVPTVRSTPSDPQQVAQFIRAAQQATDSQFSATYQVSGNGVVFHYAGRIAIAQIPNAPGTKVRTNSDGYRETGRFAYVVHEKDGSIVQWIVNEGQVSSCLRLPHDTYAHALTLTCSGPSPYLTSNGFIMQDEAFVPTVAIQEMRSFLNYPRRAPFTTTQRSRQFGRLRCLHQTYQSERLTTCEDRSGFIVSTLWRNSHLPIGIPYARSSAVLQSFSHRANPRVLSTLLKPTTTLVLLPPI